MNQGDLIVIPLKEYKALLEVKGFQEFIPTKAQKNALARAENNFSKGKSLSYHELTQKLGFTG